MTDAPATTTLQDRGLCAPGKALQPSLLTVPPSAADRLLPGDPVGQSCGVTFAVIGHPAPKGSKDWKGNDRKGRPILLESSNRLPAWRKAVAVAAVSVPWPALPGPVAMVIEFRFQRPPSHYGKRGLKPSAPAFPVGPPDVDKLLRAVFDALQDTGRLVNDSRVVLSCEAKTYCLDGQHQGAVITVLDLSDPAAPLVFLRATERLAALADHSLSPTAVLTGTVYLDGLD